MTTILARRCAEVRLPSAQCAPVTVFATTPVSAPLSRADLSAWTPSEVVKSISHEINQPLAAILLQAAAARRWLDRPEPDIARAMMALDQIASSSKRVDDIVLHMQALVERRPVDVEAFCLDTLLRQSLSILEYPLQRHRIETRAMLGLEGSLVYANRVQLGQVALNLLTNAIEALAELSERPRVLMVSTRRLGEALVELVVSDNGKGVLPQHRAHIFTARFSTKEQGVGLGLSISAAIAEVHGGRLDYQDAAQHGAAFRLVLPVGCAY